MSRQPPGSTLFPYTTLFRSTGSARALLSAGGALLSRGAYSAWGSAYGGLQPSSPMAWGGELGGYTDTETGLVLLGARYYAPALGRFISRDPSGYAGGINLYGYGLGDPVDFI